MGYSDLGSGAGASQGGKWEKLRASPDILKTQRIKERAKGRELKQRES